MSKTKDRIRESSLRYRHGLGQNFIYDDALLEELREKIYQQDKEIQRLRKAYANCNEANKKIGNELNATRWELIEARKEIEKLTRISIDYEVVREEADLCGTK